MSPRRVLGSALVSVLALSVAACGGETEAPSSPSSASSTTSQGPDVGTAGSPAPSGYTADVGPWKVKVETVATGDEATERLKQEGYPTDGPGVGTYVLLRVELQNATGKGSQEALAESFLLTDPGASGGPFLPATPLTLSYLPDLPDLREAPENYATSTTTGYVLFDTFGPDLVPGAAVILDPGGSDNVTVWAVDW